MYQQRLAAGQCMDNPMFGDQCEMYSGMGYCTPAYSQANSLNPQVDDPDCFYSTDFNRPEEPSFDGLNF